MKITVNGKQVVLGKEVTVKGLLVDQKVEMPDYVTVQVNDEFIAKEDFETLAIKENDVIEFDISWEGELYEFFQ